jgi:hypothetical protein
MDLLGLAEINLNFKQMIPSEQWKHRFGKLKTASKCATNIHTTSTDRRVFGGSAFLSNQETSHKIEESGIDPLELGRWTWTLLTGRQGIKTRIIHGYRPVADHSNRAGSVYSHQEKYFYAQGQYREPRQAFLDDLGKAITQWKSKGNLIILGLDLNANSWNGPDAETILSWGLVNALQQQHPTLEPVNGTHP